MASVVKRAGPKAEQDVELGGVAGGQSANHLVSSTVVDHSVRNAWIIGAVLS